jgi:pimeloyl-ACP methyl ester carboxylesterase
MTTRWLERDGGQIAYSDQGEGPLVVCAPGIGDLRGEYRFLTPQLVDAGFRVLAMDLRGHGESTTGWPDLSAEATGSDIVALVRESGAARALVIGTSKAAGSAVWAAAEATDEVAGVVLIGPFARNVGSAPRRAIYRALFRLLFAGPWGVGAWMKFWGSLFPAQRPADFDRYAARLRANLGEPGRLAALRAMMMETSAGAIESRLGRVRAPALVVMGTADRDFPSPEEEAAALAAALHGRAELIDRAGHYPHVEFPQRTGRTIVEFAREAFGAEGTHAA